eukprot:gene9080-18266_t
MLDAETGDIHLVLNCAGIGAAARVVSGSGKPFPLNKFQQVLEVNVVGTFNVLRLVAQRMLLQ